jgi:hypothetical protein
VFWNVLAFLCILLGMFGDVVGWLLGPLFKRFFDWRDERAGRLERMKSDLRWK